MSERIELNVVAKRERPPSLANPCKELLDKKYLTLPLEQDKRYITKSGKCVHIEKIHDHLALGKLDPYYNYWDVATGGFSNFPETDPRCFVSDWWKWWEIERALRLGKKIQWKLVPGNDMLKIYPHYKDWQEYQTIENQQFMADAFRECYNNIQLLEAYDFQIAD